MKERISNSLEQNENHLSIIPIKQNKIAAGAMVLLLSFYVVLLYFFELMRDEFFVSSTLETKVYYIDIMGTVILVLGSIYLFTITFALNRIYLRNVTFSQTRYITAKFGFFYKKEISILLKDVKYEYSFIDYIFSTTTITLCGEIDGSIKIYNVKQDSVHHLNNFFKKVTLIKSD